MLPSINLIILVNLWHIDISNDNKISDVSSLWHDEQDEAVRKWMALILPPLGIWRSCLWEQTRCFSCLYLIKQQDSIFHNTEKRFCLILIPVSLSQVLIFMLSSCQDTTRKVFIAFLINTSSKLPLIHQVILHLILMLEPLKMPTQS